MTREMNKPEWERKWRNYWKEYNNSLNATKPKCKCSCEDCGAECEPYYNKKPSNSRELDEWIKPFIEKLNEGLKKL